MSEQFGPEPLGLRRNGNLTPRMVEKLARGTNRMQLRSAYNTRVRVVPGGQIVEPIMRKVRSASEAYPFDVTIGPSETEGNVVARVRPGTINSLLPTNYLSTFEIPDDVTRFITLTAAISGGIITSCALSADIDAPGAITVAEGSPPTSFAYLIAVVINAVVFRVIPNSNLTAVPVESYRVSKVTPTPGTLPYTIWYTWNVTGG